MLQKALLGIGSTRGSLESRLVFLAAAGTLAGAIDAGFSSKEPVEFGDAAETLINLSANVNQLRPSRYGAPLLMHLAIAGPDPRGTNTQVLDVVWRLLRAGG